MHDFLRKEAAARELYSGAAISRGLPAWTLFLESTAPFNKRDCGDLKGNPKAGRGLGLCPPVFGWSNPVCDDLI